MSDLKNLAALTAINTMMQGGHFSICTIDKVADLMGINCRGSDAYKTLSTLHCIDYAKMPRELRDAIPGMIEQILGIAPAYQFATMSKPVIDVTPAPHKKESSSILKLIGLK